MKKLFLLIALTFLFVGCVTAQNDSALIVNEETAQILAEKTILIADAIDKQIIKGVDNGVTGTLLSLAIAAIFRVIEKRRVIKKVKERERAKLNNFYNPQNG